MYKVRDLSDNAGTRIDVFSLLSSSAGHVIAGDVKMFQWYALKVILLFLFFVISIKKYLFINLHQPFV